MRQVGLNKVQIVYREGTTVLRMQTIKVGDTLWVQPDNPQKLKHRGRQCVVKNFHKDDLGNYIQAVVTFLDNNRSGRVDLTDLVVENKGETPGAGNDFPPSQVVRFLPEEVPDHLFTRNELKGMGRVPIQEAAAYVFYPEQKREYPLFRIEETKLTKRQSGFSLIRKDKSAEEVLEKRKHALMIRKKQTNNQ